jgi:type III pantothenate kinase
VEIRKTDVCLGRSTADSIQSGLYFGHLGALREIMTRVSNDAFDGRRPRIIATGGFSGLFADTGLFDEAVPDLVLRGLLTALTMNLS